MLIKYLLYRMNSYDGKKDSAIRLLYLMRYPNRSKLNDPFNDSFSKQNSELEEQSEEVNNIIGKTIVPTGFKPLEQHRRIINKIGYTKLMVLKWR